MASVCASCGTALRDGGCPRCPGPTRSLPRLPETGELLAERYRIGEVLGRGGMGVVYRARDQILKEDVALKVIRPELLDRTQVMARFEREVALARKLAHPNICRIHDLGVAGGLRYISMQLVEGRSLEQTLHERGPLPADEVRHIAERLLLALASAHGRGVVHRDIKPKNIVVDPRGEPVLMDFGIAKDLNPAPDGEGVSTLVGVSLGTPAYMAPEVAQGGAAGPASDLYALGITVFKLLTGRLPFEGESALAVLRKQVESPAPPVESLRPDLPPDLIAFLRGSLEKDVARRFRSAAEARRVLAVAAAESPPARELAEPIPQPAPVRPARRLGLAALVVALALALGLVALRWRGPVAGAGAPVAVVAFREAPDLGELRGAGPIVADMLITSLGRESGLRLVSRLKLEQLARAASGGPIPLEALEQATGAGRVISGSVLRGAGRLRIEAQIVDTGSGRVLHTVGREAAEGVALFELVDHVAEGLAEGLGVPAASRPVAGLTTASLAAYRAYDRGLSALARAELGPARDALEQAVAADPGFALAWVRLAVVSEQLGRRARAGEAARRGLELGERLGSAESELVRGTARRLERRWDLARGHFARYLARYPEDAFALQGAAECELGRRAWDRAVELLERAVASDPTLALAWERLGQAWLGRRDYDRALERFEVLGRKARRSSLPMVGVGRVRLARREPERAAEAFALALEREQSSVPARVGLGDAALARRDFESAARWYAEAREALPEAVEPVVGQARLALAQLELDTALARFEQLLARDEQSREGLVGVGRVAQERHAYDEARSWYERALEIDPYLVEARLALARVALEERRFEDALAELERAASIDPYDLRVVLERGQVHRLQRRFDRARLAAEEAARRDPADPEPLNLLGLVEDDRRDLERAAGWYERAVALDSRYTFAMNNLGVVKARAREWPEARRWLELAARTDAHDAVSLANLGLVSGLAGDDTEAARWFERARALDPGRIEVRLAESGVHRSAGRTAQALAVLAEARALNPRDERVACERGRALAELGRPAEAEAAFAEALAVNPRLLEAILGLSGLALERGEVAGALRRLEVEIGERDTAGALGAGRVLLAAGRRREAQVWFARALAADPSNAWLAWEAAQALAGAGERSEAMRLLVIAIERGFDDAGLLIASPALEPLRGDPEFVALVGRLGAGKAGNR